MFTRAGYTDLLLTDLCNKQHMALYIKLSMEVTLNYSRVP